MRRGTSGANEIYPEPCIDQNVSGSITVRDNGFLADDAFSVSLDGLIVCVTAIGASNTCGIGNLRSGTATLTLVAVIAPDNVGTYERHWLMALPSQAEQLKGQAPYRKGDQHLSLSPSLAGHSH